MGGKKIEKKNEVLLSIFEGVRNRLGKVWLENEGSCES